MVKKRIPNYGNISAEQRELLSQVLADPLLFFRANLRIVDKMGNVVPFVLNAQQMVLHNEIMRQEKLGRPVRIIILKARQLGFSTYVAAYFYYKTIMNRNAMSYVVAHKNEASTNIFNKMKMFYELSHPLLQPMRKNSNAKELIFDNPDENRFARSACPGQNSTLKIESAFNKDAGRSDTIRFLHVSELAFWNHASETMLSLSQAVPNQPGTAIIIESTANGIGGTYYDMWKKAVAGENGYTPLFFPWHEFPEYSQTPESFTATEEEEELAKIYGLTDGQLAWRRWCMASNCGGDLDLFHQEYPMTPEEAFIASGRPVFNVAALDRVMQLVKPPLRVGRVMEVPSGNENRVAFQSMYKGFLRVYHEPEEGRQYVVGIDVALGKATSDYSCMQVLDKETKEQVAVWHGHIDPDELGAEASFLGRWYNNALLVPEVNSVGIATLNALRRLHYPRIFRRTTVGKTEDKTTTDYGFNTNRQTKPLIINRLAKLIREKAEQIHDRDTISECLTYVIEDDGVKTNAQEGCYDDRVMALALALYGCEYREYGDTQAKEFREERLDVLYSGVNNTTGY